MTKTTDNKLLLVLPPLIQPNAPYPSLTHLSAFLRNKGVDSTAYDLSIDLLDTLFTRKNISMVFDSISRKSLPKHLKIPFSNRDFYINNIEPVKYFLQNRCPEMATRFASTDFYENINRFPDDEELEWLYGTAGTTDRAKYLCALFIKNMCELISVVDYNFQLIKYAERISTYLETFDPILNELNKPNTFITSIMLDLLENKIDEQQPSHIGFSVPFPGNLLTAIQCAKHIRNKHPEIKIIMGGGYVNTELRQISDTTLFDYIDFLTFDDGEIALLNILTGKPLLRTAILEDGKIVFHNSTDTSSSSIYEIDGIPDLTQGIDYHKYFNFTDSTNQMHRLWSDGCWHKLMLAHGCYWHKCAFCDTSLDYICRYVPNDVTKVVDIMESLINSTGIRGFHFIDEAAPPVLLHRLAEEIIRRHLTLSYWTNIRFDRNFTPELCYLLARSGCIAVSGGLEVASPRILKLINKGVTIESATECMRNLRNNNILVHAYLMYGFPTQTIPELYDSLTTVRKLFQEDLIQSAFWHRYAMTIHSPSGQHPESYNAKRLDKTSNPFANNEIPFTEAKQPDWTDFQKGLDLATFNFMRQAGFEIPIKKWFNKKS